jgi:hypothetical protein
MKAIARQKLEAVIPGSKDTAMIAVRVVLYTADRRRQLPFPVKPLNYIVGQTVEQPSSGYAAAQSQLPSSLVYYLEIPIGEAPVVEYEIDVPEDFAGQALSARFMVADADIVDGMYWHDEAWYSRDDYVDVQVPLSVAVSSALQGLDTWLAAELAKPTKAEQAMLGWHTPESIAEFHKVADGVHALGNLLRDRINADPAIRKECEDVYATLVACYQAYERNDPQLLERMWHIPRQTIVKRIKALRDFTRPPAAYRKAA